MEYEQAVKLKQKGYPQPSLFQLRQLWAVNVGGIKLVCWVQDVSADGKRAYLISPGQKTVTPGWIDRTRPMTFFCPIAEDVVMQIGKDVSITYNSNVFICRYSGKEVRESTFLEAIFAAYCESRQTVKNG